MRTDLAIPLYPYLPYVFDDKVVAICKGISDYGQDYIDSFNALNLPIYQSKIGEFLDYVGVNLYGIPRPIYPVGVIETTGEINNFALNEIELNKLLITYPNQFFIATDEVYKRVIDWHHYKGDGDLFNVRHLKRRIMRFLTGNTVSQTYQISVSFGLNNQCNITLYENGNINLRPSATINDGELNSYAINELRAKKIPFTPFELAEIFKKSVEMGVLELPFQYNYVVSIQ